MRRFAPIALALLAASPLALSAPAMADELAEGFRAPPNSARPRVWWHWMNGNVTIEGIEKDLAWLAEIGIGGLQNFDASLGTPQVVEKRLVYMTPEWKAAFKHAVTLAEAKGLEFAIAASPGWSETGGPWVQPKDGMKKLVWSETLLTGGKPFTGKLVAPPQVTGPFQDLPFHDPLAGFAGEKPKAPPSASGDVAVIAYPVSAAMLPQPQAAALDGSALDAAALGDAALSSDVSVKTKHADGAGGIVLTYPKAVTIRSARFFMADAKPVFGDALFIPTLEVETATGWQMLADFPLIEASTTASFPAATGKRYRLMLTPGSGKARIGLVEGAPGAVSIDIFAKKFPESVKIGEFSLSAEPRVSQAETKAGYASPIDFHSLSPETDSPGVAPARVIDLTAKLRPDGALDWTPPDGSAWKIVRFGWSLTGKTNHPATPEATGLEVDKYDAAAVRAYLEHYLGMYRDAVGPDLIGAKGIRALLTDSIEVGHANWSPVLFEEFAKRRGYDMRPWMPVLSGAVIGSAGQSEKFLFDYRTTLGELLVDAHYGTIAKVARENGMTLYGEALEDVRPMLGDDLAMRKFTDVPMAALWTWNRGSVARPTLTGDMKGAASVAHIYGQNIVAAESMTAANAPWAFAPHDLKRVIDLEFALGVNRPVIHTSVHQPLDKKPGLSLAIFGQYFNRNDSWAAMAKPWVDYIARTSFMLQQGRNHADIAWFIGEDTPVTALYAYGPPAGIPRSHAFDFVNADMLGDALTVDGKVLVAKGGARFRALYLGGTSQVMTLATLKRIAAIADAGVPVIGARPQRSPSLKDDSAAFAALADRVWSRPNIVAESDPEAAMAKLGLAPELSLTARNADNEILFVHRKLADGDVFFLNNRKDRPESITASFAVTGKAPELWDAVTGKARDLPYAVVNGRTTISLDLAPEDAKFVVLRKVAVGASPAEPANPEIFADKIEPKSWTVTFEPGRGAPAGITLDRLQPLNTHSDPGVSYFSGVATYRASFTLPQGRKPGQKLSLDLGEVRDVAEVRINGKDAGTVWFAPWRVDAGALVKRGTNTLEIRVANTWVNRLIGDQQPGATKLTFTVAPTYKPDAPLRPSGLIGPITLHGGE